MEAQERDIAIRVSHLNKRYKLYRHNRDRVADALGLPGAHYTEHMALQDVSMTVYRGETVGIIGTNGSGKSTPRPDFGAPRARRGLQHGVQWD